MASVVETVILANANSIPAQDTDCKTFTTDNTDNTDLKDRVILSPVRVIREIRGFLQFVANCVLYPSDSGRT
jgi:hypothetical protein